MNRPPMRRIGIVETIDQGNVSRLRLTLECGHVVERARRETGRNKRIACADCQDNL